MKKNKYHYVFFLILMALAMAFVLFYKWWSVIDDDDISCHAEYNLKSYGVIMKVSIYLSINYNNHANIDMIGDITDQGKNYKVSRYYDFNYEKASSQRYRLTNLKLSKRESDNALDTQVMSLIFNLDSKKETVINITKIMNSYVIGNMHSPFLICVRYLD